MAKCHQPILARQGAHRNCSDLSVLGLLSTFLSHVNSSLQVLFVRKEIWLHPATCFGILGYCESSDLVSRSRTERASMIYRDCSDSAVMKTQLQRWQYICTNALLQELFHSNLLSFFNASIITWLLLNVCVEAVFDYFVSYFWHILKWFFLVWQWQ